MCPSQVSRVHAQDCTRVHKEPTDITTARRLNKLPALSIKASVVKGSNFCGSESRDEQRRHSFPASCISPWSFLRAGNYEDIRRPTWDQQGCKELSRSREREYKSVSRTASTSNRKYGIRDSVKCKPIVVDMWHQTIV